jgi:hypothetical protein
MRWIGWRIGEREDDVVAGVDGALASGGAGEWGSFARRSEEGGASSSPTTGEAKSVTRGFAAKNLVGLGEEEWRRARDREIAMIFQEPMTSLNPARPSWFSSAPRAHTPESC